jgi:hypothetical protein
MVEDPPPGAGIGFGEKPAVAPEGSPLDDSVIAALKPFATAVEMVVWPLEPCWIDTDEGEAEMVKSGLPPPPKIAW